MTIALLATGDEIVHGDTLNTNAHYLAHALGSEGLPLGFHLSCSDKEQDILHSLEFLTKYHDIIISIGGLGPTTDDITRFALAQFTGSPLVQHEEAFNHVKQRLDKTNMVMNQGHLQQCLFPEEARLLPNPEGSALGCYYQWNNKIFIMLPGPPRECLPMFHRYALPLLQQTAHSQKQILKWRIFGLAEGEIAQILEDALAQVECQTGYRWEAPYIEFKVRCRPEWVEPIKAIVEPILAPHIICSNDKKASEALCELILNRNERLTIIDEATGGLLESLLSKPEVHHLVNFHHHIKGQFTYHITGLNEYWQNKASNGSTQVHIKCSNGEIKHSETHTIPYRLRAMVRDYAVEWLSFRLFHLINQLHH